MKGKNNRIFVSLVKNYIVFVILLIIVLIISSIFSVYNLGKEIEKGNKPMLWASFIVTEDYENIDSSDIEQLGGWIEILDSDLNVIYTKGDKKDQKSKYLKEEVFTMLDASMIDNNKYYASIDTFYRNNELYYCMVKIPGDKVNVNFSFTTAPYDVFKMFYNAVIKAAILFVVLFIINVWLFSRWTSKKISRPLEKITDGIKDMTRGDYSTRLNFKAEKEFEVIRDSFNYMVDNLENIEKENKELEESKMRMLADLSHDIKTPMTTIQGYINALCEGMVTEEGKKQKYYKTIYNKCLRVDELINDMFEFVKINSSEYKLSKSIYDFNEFIREIVAEHYQEIEDKKFNLNLEITEKEVLVIFDIKLMARAISNIITNTIKYNPEGTNIRIEVIEKEDKIILEIADSGIGIPDKEKERIFDAFVRGDKVRTSDGGTGLGLSISKNIIEKHEGIIKISNGENEEVTVFTIVLNK